MSGTADAEDKWAVFYGPDRGMRLDSAQATTGAPDLRVSTPGLSTASTAAEELRQSTSQAMAKLTAAHGGVAKAAEGFTFATTLADVHSSWTERLGKIRDECHDLAGNFKATADAHNQNDARTKAWFDSQQSPQSGR